MEHTAVRRLPKSASLDGLRVFAVVLTSLVHLLPDSVPGGIFGVDVFFVLSGFLITALLLTELSATGRVDFRRFYIRRARRLLPAVIALLVVFTLAVLVTGPDRRDIVVAVVVDIAVLSYTFNWTDVFGHSPPWQVDHLWSLSVEEQFYIVWPLVLVLMIRRVSRRTAVLVTLAAMLGSTVAQTVVFHRTGSVPWAYLTSPLHAQGILLGCLLAMLFCWRLADPVLHWLSRHSWPAVLGLVLIVALSLSTGIEDRFTYSGGMFAVVVAAGIVIATLAAQEADLGDGRLHRLFGLPLLAALGRRTYSIYLWQNFLAWVLTPLREGPWWIPANVVATLVAAELSYRFVEQRFMARRQVVPRHALTEDLVEQRRLTAVIPEAEKRRS
ncbi:acyltransferase family protein [Microlunatus soli]|uniref:Peptidoglycan/LPS O-acetylase OafA/YrhL, contains acyltransferase and SGNH-hydrolase domains n=1 Tax=Microlunatus soli TaxID=630515 RepID=A0A1H1WCC3_9ACTN|nr:acyltransferase [Microlunatus soli]SDS94988.1 Peptidoglycan/LPS O-acetylase OafA/YrhL, contains acyltransferase and SGNH-hydrolase domains [Microlunatus soli]